MPKKTAFRFQIFTRQRMQMSFSAHRIMAERKPLLQMLAGGNAEAAQGTPIFRRDF